MSRLRRLRSERGSVLVFVAILTPALVAAFALAVDVGDWFVSQRALQNRVDAAAFAGSDKWGACFDGTGTGFTVMQNEANSYAARNPKSGGLNGQLQPLAFNSSTFPPTNINGFTDPDAPPPTPCEPSPSPPPPPTSPNPPSSTGGKYVFDVKATENHVPLILHGFFPDILGPNVHATARLELRRVQSLNPSMPLAVPDVNPGSVSITLVDTKPKTPTVLATCSTTSGYAQFGTCAFARTAADSPAVVAGAGTKTWTFSNIKATIPNGDQSSILVRIGLGSAAQDCPSGSPGGATYVCVDAGDPPSIEATPTPGFANGSNTYSIAVTLEGNFQVYTPCAGAGTGAGYSCATDPTIKLRFADSAGSHTYAIDCGTIPGGAGPGADFYQQIRYGCANPFQVNVADSCPDSVTSPPDCAPVNNAVGDKVGQLRQAMNDRFGCPANNYPDTTVANDPRIIILIVTDFSAFYGNGGGSSTQVPVVTYAAFYVTGWDGGPGATCASNAPYPAVDAKDKPHGDIWGHFITYITSAAPSADSCTVGALTPCTPTLVR